MSEFRYHRPSRFPPIIKNLIIINALVYVAQLTWENQYHLTERLTLYPLIPDKLYQLALQLRIIGTAQHFKPYQVFTHLFTHAPPPMIFHILFNMFALWMFGR